MGKVTCSYCEGKFEFSVVYMMHPCTPKENSFSCKMSQVDEVSQCSDDVKDCSNLISKACNWNESTHPCYRFPKELLPYFPTPGTYSNNCCAKNDPESLNIGRKRSSDDEISQVTKREKRLFL
ncbi:hypothetical protein NPIL_270541 [Nephila pilipes]|uniref:Uncharacterized protein n=1 Tax=Nephila pilipes TaxID=299642 RepID=A0A8X6Q3N4_NEPPI|nr:hypothetical protein NPIL_270541 [Nephila pilipes]